VLSVTSSRITYQGFLCFWSVIWNPLLKQDIVKVESVQRRFTKRLNLKGFHNLPYTTRLSNLGLDSLHCHCTKADLSMCYKITNNHTRTQFASSFTFSLSSKTRGSSRKLDKSHVLTVRDGHSFAKCIVNTWNSLPDLCCPNLLLPSDIKLTNCIFLIIVITEFCIVVHCFALSCVL